MVLLMAERYTVWLGDVSTVRVLEYNNDGVKYICIQVPPNTLLDVAT